MSTETHRRPRLLPGLALAVAAALAAPGEAVADAQDPAALCGAALADAEPAHGLPAHLLSAIAKVESGRWSAREGDVLAWPWTVMAEGRGRYLPTKQAAIAEVKALRTKGVRNIDVGCMQVNLMHHPRAFASLEDAFDPARNVAYAARFLSRLRTESRSWTKAIGRYHSNTPALSGRYRLKVFRAWRKERHQANAARREALREAREQRAEAQRPTAAGQIGAVVFGVKPR